MRKITRVGWLARLTGVSPLSIRRLVSTGVVPARRLPGSRDNWRFSAAKLPTIVDALIASGLLDESERESVLAKAAAESGASENQVTA